ncbi:hypothetical protein ABEO68_08280 [Bacillus licheniformis]|uniref:hypothetical protein n=1 Tax=Bacillus licheniformis TaxID=1402 RepID=UPI00164B22E9|nr:hypothetical protein [Bacillus licheniformis]MBS2763009.1 hypothetical protein [Bacillus licheniformis]
MKKKQKNTKGVKTLGISGMRPRGLEPPRGCPHALNLVKTYRGLQKLLFKAYVYFIYTYFHHFSRILGTKWALFLDCKRTTK